MISLDYLLEISGIKIEGNFHTSIHWFISGIISFYITGYLKFDHSEKKILEKKREIILLLCSVYLSLPHMDFEKYFSQFGPIFAVML